MASLNELVKQFENKPYDELVTTAKYFYDQVAKVVSVIFEEKDNSAKMMLSIICSCVSVDGEISDLECKFLSDVTGMELSFLINSKAGLANLGGIEAQELTDKLADALPNEVKASLVGLCLCFLAVDGDVNFSEAQFFVKLIEE